MKLKPYHGRKTCGEEMDGWGFDGPVIEIDRLVWEGFDRIKYSKEGGELTPLVIEGDLLYFCAYYYGDFAIPGDINIKLGDDECTIEAGGFVWTYGRVIRYIDSNGIYQWLETDDSGLFYEGKHYEKFEITQSSQGNCSPDGAA